MRERVKISILYLWQCILEGIQYLVFEAPDSKWIIAAVTVLFYGYIPVDCGSNSNSGPNSPPGGPHPGLANGNPLKDQVHRLNNNVYSFLIQSIFTILTKIFGHCPHLTVLQAWNVLATFFLLVNWCCDAQLMLLTVMSLFVWLSRVGYEKGMVVFLQNNKKCKYFLIKQTRCTVTSFVGKYEGLIVKHILVVYAISACTQYLATNVT